MKNTTGLTSVLGALLALLPLNSTAYMGPDSTQAHLDFTAYFHLEGEQTPTRAAARELIDQHLEYLYGPMGLSTYKAAPRGVGEARNIKIEANTTGTTVTYSYNGVFVLQKGPRKYYEIYLPTTIPDEESPFYLLGFGRSSTINKCTDEHYASFGDFWYFWGPSELEGREECPLQRDVHYQVVTTNVERIANTTSSVPDYENLPDENGTIAVTLFMGMDDPDKVSPQDGRWNPFGSSDLNAANFVTLRNMILNDLGFSAGQPWQGQQILAVSPPGSYEAYPYIEELTRTYPRAGGQEYRVVVRLFFGPTGFGEDSTPFHYFLKEALQKASVLMYDGHSGLGGNIDLREIEARLRELRLREIDRRITLQPKKGRYQVYFFNSCSSFSYYNDMLFKYKRNTDRSSDKYDPNGTKYLDILTTGLETPFDGSPPANFALIRAVHNWAYNGNRTGYRTIVERLNMENLIGVNGDEDNPTTTD